MKQKVLKQYRIIAGQDKPDIIYAGPGMSGGSIENTEHGYKLVINEKGSIILALGIQAAPGTQVFINENKFPFMIGHSGFFEIENAEQLHINTLSIDLTTYLSRTIQLIIDIVVEQDEEVRKI